MDLRSRVIYILFVSAVLLTATAAHAEKKSKEKNKTGNKKNYCIECHNYLTGRLQKPVAGWNVSIHQEAGITCNKCHGGNPHINDKNRSKAAAYRFVGSPKREEVVKMCGREGCHTLQRLQFEIGPHYKSVLRSGKPGCSFCHGSHSVKIASPNIIKEKACTQCHKADYARDILQSINTIDKGISGVAQNIDYLIDNQAEVFYLQDRLGRVKQLFRALLHVFSKADLQSTKKIIELEIENLRTDSGSKVALFRRLDLMYLLTLLFSLITIVGFLVYTIYMLYRRKKAPDNL